MDGVALSTFQREIGAGAVVGELGLSLWLSVLAGGSGSSSTPWIGTGRTGKDEKPGAVFRARLELEGFTFDCKPQPLLEFFVGFFRLLMFISKEP